MKQIIKDTLMYITCLVSMYGMMLVAIESVDGANWFQTICIVIAYSVLIATMVIASIMFFTMSDEVDDKSP